MALLAIKDTKYEEARNALIPAASRFADGATTTPESSADYARTWSRNFLDRMQFLAVEAGLITPEANNITKKVAA